MTSDICDQPSHVSGHAMVQHHTLYEVTQAMTVDSTSMRKHLLQLLQSARSGSPAMDVLVVGTLILIMLALCISAAAHLRETERKEETRANERSEPKAEPREEISRPEFRPPRRSQGFRDFETGSSSRSASRFWRPKLTQLPREKRLLHWEMSQQLLGERQRFILTIRQKEDTFVRIRVNEFEEYGITLWDNSDRLLASVKTELLHTTEWKSPEICNEKDEVFAEVSKDSIFGGAGMLLPDQISFWRQRFVVKDVTTGSAIFRLEGTLEDRRMRILDSFGNKACQVETMNTPSEKIIEVEEDSDPVLMLCMIFAAEKMRLVLRNASGWQT